MARISWHPAFIQAIQLELEDYLDVLTFETEHQLTTEPLKIDVLIALPPFILPVSVNISQSSVCGFAFVVVYFSIKSQGQSATLSPDSNTQHI